MSSLFVLVIGSSSQLNLVPAPHHSKLGNLSKNIAMAELKCHFSELKSIFKYHRDIDEEKQ
tara:strand:- start:2967 stop:3149 length:183 start_codon:yes stop_codon:yes gene_type:complete